MNQNSPVTNLLARILAPLRTPAQRACFIVASTGLLFMIAGSVVFAIATNNGTYGGYQFSDLVFDLRSFRDSDFPGHFGIRTFQLGLTMSVVGGLVGYWYGSTLGAVARWIRQGQDQSPGVDGSGNPASAPAASPNLRGTAQPEISTLMPNATSEIRDKWLVYTKTIHFKDDVPLADRIASFAPLIRAYLQKSYPALNDLPAKVFWTMIFAAIEHAKTHPVADLNNAIAQLSERFGPVPGGPQAPSRSAQSAAAGQPVPAKGTQPQTRQQGRSALLAVARYFEINGQPAVVVEGVNFGALRNQRGSWGEEEPAIIQSRGRVISAEEFAALRAGDLDWGGRLADNLNLNVLLEELGLIAPPP